MHPCISDSFNIIDLFTLQVFTLRDSFLEHILRFLVISDKIFLIILDSLEVVCETAEVLSGIINLFRKLGVAISFIEKIIFHVLINFV